MVDQCCSKCANHSSAYLMAGTKIRSNLLTVLRSSLVSCCAFSFASNCMP